MITLIATRPMSVRIGKNPARTPAIGKPVENDILKFWDKTKQTEALKKMGAIVTAEEWKKILAELAKKEEEKEKAETVEVVQEKIEPVVNVGSVRK